MALPVHPRDLVGPDSVVTAAERVAQYFTSYTGRLFDRIAAEGPPDRFTPADLYAVACLSAPVVPEVGVRLIEDREGSFRRLLNLIPVGCPIRDIRARVVLADSSPASQLYELLRTMDGIGPTRASKLMAVKRPALIPIRDSYVEDALNARHLSQWWLPMVEAWTDPRLIQSLDHLRALANQHFADAIPAFVTDLRLLDVVLWRSASRTTGPT